MKLVEAAEGYAEQLSKMLYGSLDKITTATGNKLDAGGRPLTFEMLYEMLDKIEWTLDENDELFTPSLAGPDTAKLPQPTPEQVKMLEELKPESWRSCLLSDAVAAYLEAVSERAFDEPLMALLRARGFTSVRLVHGAREFGKDVIAQRDGAQWGFQSKAGDIGHPEWRRLTGQLDELRVVNLGHGAFNTELPRRAVLVTTGRLVGNAPELYGDYNKRANERGEPELELWDRDILLGQLAGDPESVLSGSIDGQLMSILGAAQAWTPTMPELEVFSRRWTAWEPDRLAGLGVIEAALVCEKLRGVTTRPGLSSRAVPRPRGVGLGSGSPARRHVGPGGAVTVRGVCPRAVGEMRRRVAGAPAAQ